MQYVAAKKAVCNILIDIRLSHTHTINHKLIYCYMIVQLFFLAKNTTIQGVFPNLRISNLAIIQPFLRVFDIGRPFLHTTCRLIFKNIYKVYKILL